MKSAEGLKKITLRIAVSVLQNQDHSLLVFILAP